ncbi:hypothetical protein MHYP_G00188980 [Metynnis hypsauchen]
MEWWRKRLYLIFMLLLWENASGIGVWNGRSALYQKTSDLIAPGIQPLPFVQQDSSVAANGVQSVEVGATNAGSLSNLNTRLVSLNQNIQGVATNSDVLSAASGSVSTLSPGFSSSGEALGNTQRFGAQPIYGQHALPPQPQNAYTAQSTWSSDYASSISLSPFGLVPVKPQSPTNLAVPGFQTLPSSRPVSLSQSLVSDVPVSQQSGYSIWPGWYASQRLGTQSASQPSQNAPVFQTQPNKPLPQASWDTTTTVAQSSYGVQTMGSSSWSTFSGRQSILSPSRSQSTPSRYAPGSLTQLASPSQTSSLWPDTQSQVPDVQTQASHNPVLPSQTLASPYTSPSQIQARADPSGQAQWYKVALSQVKAGQSNKPLSPPQSLGSGYDQAASGNYPSVSQSQSALGTWGFVSPGQSAPTATLTQSGVSSPAFQTSNRFSTTSQDAIGASVSKPSHRAQTSVAWRTPTVSLSLGQTSPGTAASVATRQEIPSAALVPQSRGTYAALQSQASSPWQTPGNYHPVLQSVAPLGGYFDKYSPVSNVPASSSAQDALGTFGLLQSSYGFAQRLNEPHVYKPGQFSSVKH